MSLDSSRANERINMSVRKVGITVVRHQETKGCTLRLHLWYPNGQPIEPEMVTALRTWDQLRPITENRRAAVGQLPPSRLFIDMARAHDLRPPYRRKRRISPALTPSEVRRHIAIGDRLWKLELWLVRWYGIGTQQDDSLVIAQHYPTYAVHRFGPVPRRDA